MKSCFSMPRSMSRPSRTSTDTEELLRQLPSMRLKPQTTGKVMVMVKAMAMVTAIDPRVTPRKLVANAGHLTPRGSVLHGASAATSVAIRITLAHVVGQSPRTVTEDHTAGAGRRVQRAKEGEGQGLDAN